MFQKIIGLQIENSICLEEIKDEPFVSIKKGNALRHIVDQVIKRCRNCKTNITFEGEDPHTVAGFVSAGHGVSIIPDIKGLNEYNVKKISVKEPICERKIGVSWVKGDICLLLQHNLKII